jgi:hypothetical protein
LGGFVDISMNRAPNFARPNHRPFPGWRLLRMPTLELAMLFYRWRDAW